MSGAQRRLPLRRPFRTPRVLAGVALAFVLACIGYAGWVEPAWLEITLHERADPTAAEPPIRVVQLSDLHLQRMGGLERAVAAAVLAQTPDLVVLSGDVIDDPQALPELEMFLRALGDVPKVAVLGNWEHWSGVALPTLRQAYEQHHGTLLINASARYTVGSRTLWVLGLDDFTAGRPDARLLDALPSVGPTLVVQHSPGWFSSPEIAHRSANATLCLAGHTHGGQVTLFGWPLVTPPGSGEFVHGFADSALCPIFVSRGIGTSLLPLRFGARPEMAVFTL
ncbi:MAG: metallophosphoesterase [Gammaproteobacteria bacterium]